MRHPSTGTSPATDTTPATDTGPVTDTAPPTDSAPPTDTTPVAAGPTEGRTTLANPRRSRRMRAVLSAGLATAALAAVSAPVLSSSAPGASWTLDSDEATVAIDRVALSPADRAALVERRTSRSAARGEAAEEALPEVVGTRYATVDLNVRTTAEEDAKVVDVLDAGDKVRITDTTEDGFRQILYKDRARWVKGEYLSKDKPDPRPRGLSGAACASGSGVEAGLRSTTIAVHRAVCAAFPSIHSYGGTRGGGGNHGTGRALDIMVSGSTGDRVAEFVRANASALGVSEVIWSQRIWTVQRAGEGWRRMSDRGSTTANHYDHVHVSTY